MTMHCSFCGKSVHDVQKMIASGINAEICICEDCVVTCLEIYRAEGVEEIETNAGEKINLLRLYEEPPD